MLLSRQLSFHLNEPHRLSLAASLAVALHLLAIAVLPGITQLTDTLERQISVRLVAEPASKKIERALQAPQPPPQSEPTTHKSLPIDDQPQPLDPESRKEVEHEPITAALINRFTGREADAAVNSQDKSLAEFEASFAEEVTTYKAPLSSYKNQFGDLHVRTKIGDRDVCYQRNRQFVDDDWGFNIVMFYDCSNTE